MTRGDVKTTLANDREVFDLFRSHESLRKLRVSYDFLIGRPIWWISFRLDGGADAFRKSLENSYEIWNDPRVKRFRFSAGVFSVLKRRAREKRPYLFTTENGLVNFCVPLVTGDRIIGSFGLIGLKAGIRQEILNMLAEYLAVTLDNCAKKEEIARLSATIRPRAIALSTVHTVHRIINSTLNLDELISRLAHLTAQVLRSSRCAIYLFEKPKKQLVCKALVGYPKNRAKGGKVAVGSASAEGRVARSAKSMLRKTAICIPLIDEDIIGVLTVANRKDNKEFTYFDLEILTTLAEEAVIAIKNAQLYEEQKKVTLGTIQSLAVILGTRIPNVVSPEGFLRIALRMAEELKLSEEDTQALHYATLLKDTAKIGIPEDILRKPTKLTGEEYQILREHPIKGAKIVQSFESLKTVVPIILYSREKYDGTGYPEGLKGEKIPLGARILSVINAFEAIITGRPYRNRATLKEALDEIGRNSGTQFDPKVVDIFIHIVRKEGFYRYIQNVH